MATQIQQEIFVPDTRSTKYNSSHPICALGPEEIAYTADLIRSQWPDETILRFKTITLHEPAKAELLKCFQAEYGGYTLPSIDRRAFSSYYIRNTVC